MMQIEGGVRPLNKELLVLLPIVGSVLAITYDVGYFVASDINFFSVFSITEHITFAAELLPLAILATLILIIAPIVFDKGGERAGCRTTLGQ